MLQLARVSPVLSLPFILALASCGPQAADKDEPGGGSTSDTPSSTSTTTPTPSTGTTTGPGAPAPMGGSTPAPMPGVVTPPRSTPDAGATTAPPTVMQPATPPKPGSCALDKPAFCDTLATPSPGGRSGDLDDVKWSVTRISNGYNPGQGAWITYPLGTGLICGKTVTGMVPPADYQICTDSNGPHLTQTADDGGGNVVSSFRPRQPFDFAGRTGVITFDLGGRQAGGHGFWPEIMITSDPVPAPYQDLIGIFPYPRNGIGIEMAGQPDCDYRSADPPYTHNHVSTIKLIKDWVVSGWGPNDMQADYKGTGKPSGPPCYPVNDEKMNHFELRVSQNTIELWGTDPGATTLRLLAKKDGINLPFTRGYVNFQQAHYNSGKDDHINIPKTHTFNWANVGFDGPVLPMERGYDVKDAGTPYQTSSTMLGYHISMAKPVAFPLAAMDLTGMKEASLHLNVYGFYTGRILQFRFNGGDWQDFVSDLPPNREQRSLHIPVPMNLLRAGDNMLEVRAGSTGDLAGANFDVTVR
jgi:hypothetical protein